MQIKTSLVALAEKLTNGSLKSSLVKGASGSLGLKIFYTLLSFITSILLSRILGVKGFGHYTYAISCATLVSFPAMMGLNALLTRELARFKALGAWKELSGLLKWTDRTVLLTSLLASFSVGVVVWCFRARLENEAVYSLWVAMLIIPILAFIHIRQGAIRGLGYIVKAQIPHFLIRPVLFISLTVILSFCIELSGPISVGIRVLCAGIALSVSMIMLKKHLPSPVKNVSPTFHSRLWLKSGIIFLIAGTTSIVNEQISVFLVGSLMGGKETGLYEAARKGAIFITFVLAAVNMTIGPTIARLYTYNKKGELQRLITKSARMASLSALGAASFFIFFGRWYLHLFGEEFLQASNILIILSLAYLLHVCFGPTSLILNMTGHERHTAVGLALATLMNAFLTFALIPIWGVEGAAVAQFISIIFYKVLLIIFIYKTIGINSTFLGGMPKIKPG